MGMRKRVVLVLGAIVFVGLGTAFVREFMLRSAVSSDIEKLESTVKELEERKTSLLATLDYFQSPLFQEQEAREKLGLTKPGETVVIVPEVSARTQTGKADTATARADQSASNPVRWWRYFFGA